MQYFSFFPWLAYSFCLVSLSACGKRSLSADEQWLQQNTLKNLVFVEGGTFTMGNVGYIDENGQRQRFPVNSNANLLRDVTLSNYSMLKYEITFKEVDIFTSITKREKIQGKYRHRPHFQAEYPATHVDWQQARDYCQWAGKLIGYPMDLATEAQWEYAARSRGLPVAYPTDNGKYEPGRNVASTDTQWQMPVGSWPPNPLGIYDMTDNVQEWVLDWYRGAYLRDDLVDPQGPPLDIERENKVVRGGGAALKAELIAFYIFVLNILLT